MLEFLIDPIIIFQKLLQLLPRQATHLFFHGNQRFLHGGQLFFCQENFFINRIVSFDIWILGKIAYSLVLCQNHFPVVCFQLSHDNPKQGGLSCSIDSYNGSLFIFLNMKRRLVDDFIGAKGFTNILAG